MAIPLHVQPTWPLLKGQNRRGPAKKLGSGSVTHFRSVVSLLPIEEPSSQIAEGFAILPRPLHSIRMQFVVGIAARCALGIPGPTQPGRCLALACSPS
jgi:hypothetical protein